MDEADVIVEIWLDDAGNVRPETFGFWPMKDEQDAARWAQREKLSDTIYMFATLGSVEEDWKPLSENVRNHCLGPYVVHEDGRSCGFHNRLGVWTFEDDKECLRTEHNK